MSKQINCNEPTCKNFGRFNRYCGHGEAEIEQPEPIAKVSEKRGKINKLEYKPKMKQFIADNPECQMKTKVCSGSTQCVHHSKGRQSTEKLLNVKWWKASCFKCNTWVEMQDAEARSKDLKLSKFNDHTTNA